MDVVHLARSGHGFASAAAAAADKTILECHINGINNKERNAGRTGKCRVVATKDACQTCVRNQYRVSNGEVAFRFGARGNTEDQSPQEAKEKKVDGERRWAGTGDGFREGYPVG